MMADQSRAASQGAFAGSDIASDERDISGSPENQRSEPGKAGVDGSIPSRSTTTQIVCDRCDKPMHPGAVEDAYGEYVCADCDQNRAEAAYERLCEDYHDGGSTSFKSLRDQQIEALKLK